MKINSVDNVNTTIRERLELRPVINVSGTMTALGASIIVPEALKAMSEIGSQWIEIEDLQRRASTVVARLTGGEAGFVTACCASGITLSIAGAITGTNLLAIERLPDRTDGRKDEVLIQVGHLVNYGAPVDQSIRMAGGKVIPIGAVTGTADFHVSNAISDRTAAALYVISHHTVQYGMLPLSEFAALCHEKGVPVIVDAASEYDLRRFLAEGADIAVYSGHKFLGGPTSGIVAGQKDLVRAAFLQNRGIGRAMKVGKETIAGTMAALEAWEDRDHEGIRAREAAALKLWKATLDSIAGIETHILPDPTYNPLDRLTVIVRAESGFTANGLARALAAGERPVIVRNHEVERGHFYLDPCNLHPGEAEIVAELLKATLTGPRPECAMAAPDKNSSRILSWPD
jgi:L-seryl-tRNA(Ser) seleniumtransferase